MKLSKNNKEKLLMFILGLCAVGIMIWIIVNHETIEDTFSKMLSTVAPFIYGASFAYILSPLCNRLEARLIERKHKHPHAMATAITESIFLLIIVLACIIIIPQSAKSISSLIQSAPDAMNNTQTFINNQLRTNKLLHDTFKNSSVSILESIENFVNTTVTPNIESITTSIFESLTKIGRTIFNIVLGIIISIFALFHRKTFARQLKMFTLAVLGEKRSQVVFEKASYANRVFSSFFVGKLIDSIIVGIICFISLSIMRMPYIVLISVIVTITNMIPIIGPFIGAIPSLIIILSESPVKALYFLVFIIILQQIDGHIIGPKCIGNATGLNTFWVLFSIIFFGGLWGIAGMFIGVPLFAVIYDIIRDIIYDVLNRRKVSQEVKDEIQKEIEEEIKEEEN